MEPEESPIKRVASEIGKQDRWKLNRHKSGVLWFTGLSGSGKTTLAMELERRLYQLGIRSCVLDGDSLRYGLTKDLGFSREDRKENIRRAKEVCKILADAGLLVLASFLSPYQADREMVRNAFDPGQFIEIYVQCPLEICQSRDPKGLYQQAKVGKIQEFTGLSAPYEPPATPELTLPTHELSVTQCADLIMAYLQREAFLFT